MVQKLIDTKEFLEKLNEEIMNAVNDEDYDEEAVREYDWVSGMWISTKLINKVLESTPAIEAEPVKHGKWIWVEDVPLEDGETEYDREAWYQCSECDAYDLRLKDCHADYCWSCGAKMDEVNDE